jgi:hypothetical protein
MIVAPAKAGAHNHREKLLREKVVTSFFAQQASRGIGSGLALCAPRNDSQGVLIPISFSAASMRCGGAILITSG